MATVPSLGGIDLTKEINYPVVYIAKPDRTIVGKLKDILGVNLKLKLSNTNEYQFDVPYQVQRNGVWQKNPVIDMIKERYTLKLAYNNFTEWYVIEEIGKQSADSSSNSGDTVTVTAYSLNYELTDKMIFGFDAEGINLQTAMLGGTVTNSNGDSVTWNGALSNSRWTLGYVDSDFNNTHLTFKEDKITVLDCIFKIAQAFNAVVIWDTENRKVNFYKASNVGVNRGLRLSYNTYLNAQKYLENYQRDSKTDQLVTRLHVFGKNGVSINAVNPTGSDYIEDYSFFMDGFSMDSSGNVTGHSQWMSDDLCKAITNYNNKVSSQNGQYQSLLNQLTTEQNQLTIDDNTLSDAQGKLQSAQALIDSMNAGTDNEITTMTFTANASQTATLNNSYYYAVMAKGTGADTVTIDGTAYTLTANTWSVLKKFNTATPSTGTTSSTCQVTLANTTDSVTVIYLMINASEYSGNVSTQETLTVSSGLTVTTSQTPISGSVSIVNSSGATISISDYTVSGNTITFTAGVVAGDKVTVSYQYANANTNQDIISKYGVDYNQTQVNNAQSAVNTDNQNISNTQSQITNLQSNLAVTSNFTQAEIDEWNLYIIEKNYDNSNIDDPQSLYNDAKNQFSTMHQPQILFQISLVNFMEDVKSQRDWDKFNLGDIVNVDFPYFGDNNIQAKMIEIDYDFERSDIQITLANVIDIRTGEYKFIDMLYQATSTSTAVNMNSYKWEQAYSTSNQVNAIINTAWDATKREINAGTNETVSINSRGILIKDPNDVKKFLIAQHGVLAITNDGGNTWKHAIRADGIVGEQIYGKLIAGTNLTIETDSGIFTVNNTGVTISGTSLTISNGGLPKAQLSTEVINLIDGSLQPSTAYNGVVIDSANGLVVTASNNLTRTILNATSGIAIQKQTTSTSGVWNNVFWVDTNGNLFADNLTTTRLKVQTGDATPQTLIDASAKLLNFSGFTQISGTLTGDVINGGTINGSLVNITNLNASNITAGSISANRISGGSLSLGGSGNGNGTISLYDSSGTLLYKFDNTGIYNNYWSMGNTSVTFYSFPTNGYSASHLQMTQTYPLWVTDPNGNTILSIPNGALYNNITMTVASGMSVGYNLTVNGSFYAYSNAYLEGTTSVTGSVSFSTSPSFNGGISVSGSSASLSPTTVYIEPGNWTYITANGGQGSAYFTSASYGFIFRTAQGDMTGSVGISGQRWQSMWAGSFNTTSQRSVKTNIEETDTQRSYEIIRHLGLKDYNYKRDIEVYGNGAVKRTGIIAEESPSKVLSYGEKDVDIYALLGVAVGAIQQLQMKIEKLEDIIRSHSRSLNDTANINPVKLTGSSVARSYHSDATMKNKPKMTGSAVAQSTSNKR